MKVILLSDVAKVGKKYDVVEVAPGFARNFLLARGLGDAVTKSTAKSVADLEKKREVEKVRQGVILEKAFAGIKSTVLTLKRTANEEGHLYAGVTADELAAELSTKIGASISAQHIILEKPIKELGEFSIPVELRENKAEFKVVIEAE